jgi:hypothetical protein
VGLAFEQIGPAAYFPDDGLSSENKNRGKREQYGNDGKSAGALEKVLFSHVQTISFQCIWRKASEQW